MESRQHNGWGGRRANQTGRPKKSVDYDIRIKQKLNAAINKGAREHGGVNIWQVAVNMVYDKEVQDAVKVGIFKLLKEVFVNPKNESDINVRIPSGPGLLLPEAMPDPAGEILE